MGEKSVVLKGAITPPPAGLKGAINPSSDFSSKMVPSMNTSHVM